MAFRSTKRAGPLKLIVGKPQRAPRWRAHSEPICFAGSKRARAERAARVGRWAYLAALWCAALGAVAAVLLVAARHEGDSRPTALPMLALEYEEAESQAPQLAAQPASGPRARLAMRPTSILLRRAVGCSRSCSC